MTWQWFLGGLCVLTVLAIVWIIRSMNGATCREEDYTAAMVAWALAGYPEIEGK